jgi:uncharacterized membrane protein (UPF0136 family)
MGAQKQTTTIATEKPINSSVFVPGLGYVPVSKPEEKPGFFKRVWGGITGIFKKSGITVDAQGNAIVAKTASGETIVSEPTKHNWESILATVGGLVSIFTGKSNQYTDANGVPLNQTAYNQQVKQGRTGLYLAISGLAVLIVAIVLLAKGKKNKIK